MNLFRKLCFVILLVICLCSSEQTGKAYVERLDGFYLTWYGYDVGNVTAMGTTPIPYYTIAVDPNIIPLGSYCTVVFPDGRTFECRAEDTGGMVYGYHIDMYVDELDASLDYWDNISGVTVYIH